MPLDLPESASEVESRMKTDVQREAPGSNPFLKNSVLGAIVTGGANRLYDYYIQLDALSSELLPDEATDIFLERWSSIYGKTRLPASKATGNIVASGTLASSIPIGTVFTHSDNTLYTSLATSVISNSSFVAYSITRVGTLATVILSAPHKWANNVEVTISNADQTEYNGIQTITVIDETSFSFEVSGSPTTPATGVIQVSGDSASILIESQEFQDSSTDVYPNLDMGASLSLQSPIVGVDNLAFVDAGTIGGGADQETNAQLQTRLLDRIQNPVAHFNAADIVEKAKEVPGVTRVFVQEVTPALGQVTIYFMRDNDVDPIPTGSEVTVVKNKILSIKPANTAIADVIVLSPTPVVVDFTFSALNPNTSTMQSSITANLSQFFAEEATIAVDAYREAYRAAIFNTVDIETGAVVQSFTLSDPTNDIPIASGSIGVLGTVTYP